MVTTSAPHNSFPLTPALSPQERESLRTSSEFFQRALLADRLPTVLPSPEEPASGLGKINQTGQLRGFTIHTRLVEHIYALAVMPPGGNM